MPHAWGVQNTVHRPPFVEGSEVNYFLASDGIVYVELKTFAAHAVLLRHHRLHVEDQRVPTAVVFLQQTSQSIQGLARS